MLPYKRSERIRKLLQEEISKILRDIKDPKLGFVTVTEVKISDDLSVSRVFYSVLGDEKERSDTGKVLSKATGYIRHCLSCSLELRKVPDIEFIYDDTAERAVRIYSLLDGIKDEEKTSRK
ncbi:MAG: ribosome-binding factor A [Elusimicrobia bacterium CG1_02_37_114]|nr:MAG: ribosome-binding factor A [Elusimicrobia bacterium CG1_02_37_114]PIV52399.1 MAG: ribosome-binding factor A [Elusimicrobia bacterium CG02_land_8_20_14_3_00_37_13]